MSFFKNKSKQPSIEPLEGYCPNCWGRQEYQDEIIKAAEMDHVDLNNIDQRVGWIEAYATRNLTGLKMKKEKGKYFCQACAG